MPDERLQIEISAADNASPVLRQVAASAKQEMKAVGDATGQVATASQGAFGRASSYVDQHARTIQTAGIGMVGYGAVVMGVSAKCIAAFNEQADAEARLNAAIIATGQAIDSAKLVKLAGDLQKVTTFGDETTLSMMGTLAAMGFSEQQIIDLTPRVQNLSVAFGKDLTSTAQAVGRAIKTESAGALTRFGIVIDDSILKTGDFDAIMQALDSHSRGAAEAMGKTATGGATILKNQIGELQESIGAALVPGLQAIVTVAMPVVGVMKAMAESPVGKALIIVGTAGGIAAGGLGAIGLAAPPILRGLAAIEGALVKVGITSRVTAATVSASAAEMAAATTAAGAAAAGGAAARLGLRGVLGAAGRVAGRYALPAYLAYEGVSYGLRRWQSKADEEAAAIESGATETPEEKALLKANQARWAAARAGIRPVAKQSFAEQPLALGRAEIGPDLAAIPSEEFLDVDGIAEASEATSMELASLVGDAVSAPVLEMLEAAPDLIAATLEEQFAAGVAPSQLKAQFLEQVKSGEISGSLTRVQQMISSWLSPKEQQEVSAQLSPTAWELPVQEMLPGVARMREERAQALAEFRARTENLPEQSPLEIQQMAFTARFRDIDKYRLQEAAQSWQARDDYLPDLGQGSGALAAAQRMEQEARLVLPLRPKRRPAPEPASPDYMDRTQRYGMRRTVRELPPHGELAENIRVSDETGGGQRKVLIEILFPDSVLRPSAGLLMDSVTDWVGDLQYAGEG